MSFFRFVLLVGLFSGTVLSASPLCTPQFPLQVGDRVGWLGADVAFSIRLPDGRDLWIFGDTLYGKKRVVNSNIPTMVRNSIGISTCGGDGRWNIQYAIRRDSKRKPVDYFRAQHPNTWYWAMDGFRAGEDVWVTLLCVRATEAKSALGFKTCGTDLARISDIESDPQKWTIRYFPLVPDGADAYPSASAVVDGGFADLFAMEEKDARPLLVSRIPLTGLGDPQGNLEYLARDGTWKTGFDPSNSAPVMAQGSPELSIRYHPELKKWLAVMFAPGPFSRDIVLRSAPSSVGPWSTGQVIYTVPEMTPGNAKYDKDTFCYAGKEHPEFERGDLLFTYVCNTFAVQKLATELNIYFPQTIRMPMPELETHSKTAAAER